MCIACCTEHIALIKLSCIIIFLGLTGVDVVKQLNAQGHKGPVMMVSRRGLLPAVKASVFDPFRPLCVATRDGENLL